MLHTLQQASSRIVFLLSNRFVLKIANPIKKSVNRGLKAGLAQNKEEVHIYTNSKYRSIITKIYDFDPNYEWLMSELVRPIKHEQEFEELLGFNLTTFEDILRKVFYERTTSYDNLLKMCVSDLSYYESLERHNNYQKYRYNQIKNIIQAIESNKEFFKSIISLVHNEDFLLGDLLKFSHWGKAPNGRVVLLDYGATNAIMDQYY